MIKSVSYFIPQSLIDIGRLWTLVSNQLTTLYDYYFARIKSLRTLYDPGETEQILELSQYIGAYITSYDTPRTTRSKTATAITTHQYLGVFPVVWKPTIDRILGGSSAIYSGDQYYGSFVVGQSIIGSPAVIGGATFPTGVIASKLEGEVFIDLDIVPSADQLAELIAELRPIAPHYLNVYLGNTTILDSSYFVVGLSTIGDIDVIGEDLAPLTIFNVKVKL